MKEHALNSAKVITAIKPEYVGFLTLLIEPGTPMYEQYQAGELDLLSPEEALDETKLFIENVDAEGTVFRANHASNYVPLAGTLNGEKQKILAQIQRSKEMSSYRPENFRGL